MKVAQKLVAERIRLVAGKEFNSSKGQLTLCGERRSAAESILAVVRKLGLSRTIER